MSSNTLLPVLPCFVGREVFLDLRTTGTFGKKYALLGENFPKFTFFGCHAPQNSAFLLRIFPKRVTIFFSFLCHAKVE